MAIAVIHVDNVPLSGDWDGQGWEQQSARCSNNFMSGPTPPVPPASAAAGLVWQVSGLPDPDSVVFNVSVDLPGDDEPLFTGVRNGTETTYLPTPSVTGYGPAPAMTPLHGEQAWDLYYSRGIYIASVYGASEPFMITVDGAPPMQGVSTVSVIRGLMPTHVVGVSGVPGGGAPFTVQVSGVEQATQVVTAPEPEHKPASRRPRRAASSRTRT